MLRKGSSATLVRWLDMMPEAVVRERPRLCLTRGWTYAMGTVIRPERAAEWVQLAIRATLDDQQLPDADFTGEVAALQAMIASIWDEVSDSIKYSRQALDSLPADSPWRSMMTFCLGSVLFLAGDTAGATHFLGEAVRLSQEDGSHYIQLNAASFLGDLEVLRGQLGRAAEMYEQVLTWADHSIPQKGALMAHGGLAHIFYERNQLDAALDHVKVGVEQLELVGGAWSSLVLNRTLARIQQTQGNWTEALDALERAYQNGQRTQVKVVLTQTAALRARLQLAQGELEAAVQWAADSGLSVDDAKAGHPGLREEEYLVFARVLNAQNRHAETQFLLNRLLRSAEAEGRIGSAITILVLQCLSLRTQGNPAGALTLLARALALGEAEGYCRVFLDEGEPMADLLRQTRLRDPSASYANRLLAAFSTNEFQHRTADLLPEPLSSRELEVLHLLATGASNQDIAARLFIAVSTVKKHMGHILVKLDTPNRGQAIVRARNLGLLP